MFNFVKKAEKHLNQYTLDNFAYMCGWMNWLTTD